MKHDDDSFAAGWKSRFYAVVICVAGLSCFVILLFDAALSSSSISKFAGCSTVIQHNVGRSGLMRWACSISELLCASVMDINLNT